MNFFKTLIFIVSLFIGSICLASENGWLKFNERYYVKAGSLIVLPNPKRVNFTSRMYLQNDSIGAAYLEGTNTIYCDTGKVSLKKLNFYDVNDKYMRPISAEDTDVEPNTFFYAIYLDSCKK